MAKRVFQPYLNASLVVHQIWNIALERQDGAGKGLDPLSLKPRFQYLPNEPVKGIVVERRKAKRNLIQVDIEIAHPGSNRCLGYAENISRSGVSVTLMEGTLPTTQRSVILNFRVWTGNETLYRKVYARVVRYENERIALEFAEHDFITDAIIHDLMYYQSRTRLDNSRSGIDVESAVPVEAELTA